MRIFDNPHGKYEILKVIGRGGTSVVYLAKHRTMGMLRAVKSIPKSSAGRECYFAELNILSRINIKGTPQIYDVEEDEDNLYIVEEYISGEHFDKYIESGERTMEELIKVIYEICDILTELYAAVPSGIIYNDLKPQNIIISDKGLYIVDFGNCRFEGTKDTCMISAGNASPEHIEGGRLAVQTDVYSIGVLIQRIYHAQLTVIREYDRQCDAEYLRAENVVKETISGCMERNIEDRFTSPEAVKRYIAVRFEQIRQAKMSVEKPDSTMDDKQNISKVSDEGKLSFKKSDIKAVTRFRKKSGAFRPSCVTIVSKILKKRNVPIRAAKKNKVYVYGARRFAGVTHFAVGYAGYLRTIGEKALYIERDGVNMMTNFLDKNRADVRYAEGMYIYHNCVMCPDYEDYISYDKDMDTGGCSVSVYDCGLYDKDIVCKDGKVIVVITDIKSYGSFNYVDYAENESVLYIVNFSDEQGYKRFEHNTRLNVVAMPFYDNPFVRNRRVQEFYAEVSKRLWV